MGHFSFVTADTHRTIPLAHHEIADPPKQVYLLMPDEEPLQVGLYQGNGVFGGIDVHEWMAQANASHLGISVDDWDFEERRRLGTFLDSGAVYRDAHGQLWVVCCPEFEFFARFGVKVASGNYGQPVTEGSKTPNELIDSGEWEELSPSNFGLVKYFIKLTEEPLGYWSVPASSRSATQGEITPELV